MFILTTIHPGPWTPGREMNGKSCPPDHFSHPCAINLFTVQRTLSQFRRKRQLSVGEKDFLPLLEHLLKGIYFDKRQSIYSHLDFKWNDFLKDPIVSWMSRFTEKDEWEVSKLIMTTNPSVLHSSKNLLPSAITLGQKLRFAWRSILFNLTPN